MREKPVAAESVHLPWRFVASPSRSLRPRGGRCATVVVALLRPHGQCRTGARTVTGAMLRGLIPVRPPMGSRAILHLLLHAAVPGLLAWLFWRDRFLRAWGLLLLGWLIDFDHLLADPVYAPDRCSIGFHPLHATPAILVYGALVVPRRTRLLGIGLLVHIALDAIDCLWMHHLR